MSEKPRRRRPVWVIPTGGSRRAEIEQCSVCGGSVWRGRAEDRVSWATDCEPGALSALGEALALLAGRETYSLRWRGDHHELERDRDQFSIPAAPAASVKGVDILARHSCRGWLELPRTKSRVDEMKAEQSQATPPIDPPF